MHTVKSAGAGVTPKIAPKSFRLSSRLEFSSIRFVVGHAIALDVTDAARDYIHLYRGDGTALAESLGRIQRTAATILTAIDLNEAATEEGTRTAA